MYNKDEMVRITKEPCPKGLLEPVWCNNINVKQLKQNYKR